MQEQFDQPQAQPGEQKPGPRRNLEVLHYNDGYLIVRYTGDSGAKLAFNRHRYDPGALGGEALVTTSSGNNYLIRTNEDATVVVNVRASKESGKLVAAYNTRYPAELPPVVFQKPWEIPGFGSTTPVTEVLLKYKWAHLINDTGHCKIDAPNPIDETKRQLEPYGYTDHFSELLNAAGLGSSSSAEEHPEQAAPSIIEGLRRGASDLERGIAAKQAELYESALLVLMERSNDNTELVNAMRDFLRSLEQRVYFGDSNQPLSPGQQEDLVQFFKASADRLGGKDERGQRTGWSVRV